MSYKIIKYTNTYLDPLTSLLTKAFAIKNKDKKRLVLWKYFDSYFNGNTITYLALDETNHVVGHYVTLPISVSYGDKTLKTTLSTDAATDPLHRGRGLMSQMADKLYGDVRSKGYEFSFGYPNEVGVAMDRHSKRYGYQLVGKYIRYTKIILIKKRCPYQLIPVVKASDITTFTTVSTPYFTIRKDAKYIIWRYLRKPHNDYEIFRIVNDQKTLGYIVTNSTNNKCGVIDIITDYSDKEHMKQVLRAIENTALEKGIRIVVYTVMDNTYWRGMFGFTYFRKIKPVRYYFSIHLHTKSNREKILNPDSWISLSGDIL